MKRKMIRRSIFGTVGGGAGLFALGRDRALALDAMSAGGDMVTSANIAVVRRWIDEVVNGDSLDVADEIFAPGYISHPDGGTVATVKRTAARWRSTHTRGYAAIDDIVASGDRVAVRVTWYGTSRTGAATNSRVNNRIALGVAIFRIAGGRIAEAWGLTDGVRQM